MFYFSIGSSRFYYVPIVFVVTMYDCLTSVCRQLKCAIVNIYRPFTGPLPSALSPPKDKAITVHFNAILPKAAWGWDDSTSEIYIRFMDVELGHKSYDLGPGEIKR